MNKNQKGNPVNDQLTQEMAEIKGEITEVFEPAIRQNEDFRRMI